MGERCSDVGCTCEDGVGAGVGAEGQEGEVLVCCAVIVLGFVLEECLAEVTAPMPSRSTSPNFDDTAHSPKWNWQNDCNEHKRRSQPWRPPTTTCCPPGDQSSKVWAATSYSSQCSMMNGSRYPADHNDPTGRAEKSSAP